MHPILAGGRRLSLYLLLFVPPSLLLADLMARHADASRSLALLLVLPPMLLHAFACLTSSYLCRSLPLESTGTGRLLLSQATAALCASVLLGLYGYLWAGALERTAKGAGALGLWQAGLPQLLLAGLLIFSIMVAVHYLLAAVENSRRAEQQALELRMLAREAELQALKAQIDPHFLFNSLNAVASLVSSEPQRARAVCVRLADFLRRSLRLHGSDSQSLEAELTLVEHYLAIERERLGERLQVSIDVPERCLQAAVPPLLLQPLVENAVHHGVAASVEGGCLGLRAERTDDSLILWVENTWDPNAPSQRGEGIGLENVRRRLETRFGSRSNLEVRAGETFAVRLEIPWRQAEQEPGSTPEQRPRQRHDQHE